MKIKYLSISLLFFFFISCGGDDSSSSSQESFFCEISKQKGLVKQEYLLPGKHEGSVEVLVKNNEARVITRKKFFNISKSEMDDFCEDYAELYEDDFKAVFECGGNSLYVSQSMSVDAIGSPSEVAAELQAECYDYEDEYYHSAHSSSNTMKESSSSEENTSSSFGKSSSSRKKLNLSSSVEKPTSSSSETPIARVYHDDVFDGFYLAPEAFDGDSALFFEDFDGRVLCLYSDSLYNTGFPMQEDLASGKLEFFFRPHEDFFDAPRVLIGNDGARLLIYFDGDNLVLMMNKNNFFRFIKEPVEIQDDWNYVKAQWGNDSAYLYLNNVKVGGMELIGGYVASTRFGEQELIIGQKSNCCMSGADMNKSMRTSVDFGPIKLSVPYQKAAVSEDPLDDDPAEEGSEGGVPVSENPLDNGPAEEGSEGGAPVSENPLDDDPAEGDAEGELPAAEVP